MDGIKRKSLDRQFIMQRAMVANSEEIPEVDGSVVNIMARPFQSQATLTRNLAPGFSSKAGNKATRLFVKMSFLAKKFGARLN